MAVKHGKSLSGSWNSAPISDVTNFQVSKSNNAGAYASSSTAGETKRTSGVNDSTGSFTILADAMPTLMVQGASGTLILTSDGTVEVYNKSVRILDIAFNVNVQNNIEATVQFGQA